VTNGIKSKLLTSLPLEKGVLSRSEGEGFALNFILKESPVIPSECHPLYRPKKS